LEERNLDYIIIIVYLLGVASLGILSGGKQKSVKDYFQGSKKIPWWAICFSIVAAETSTLTFISIPGLSYLTNLNFLQVAVGFLIGRIIVAKVFLPAHFKGELGTAYSFLEKRFGSKTRSFASVVFLFTRTAADGVRLYATAIPLYLLLDINPVIAILAIGVVSLLYTYTGGITGVIWVDVIQMFIYIGGALIAGVLLIHHLPEGLNSVMNSALEGNKFEIVNLGFNGTIPGFFNDPYTLFAGLIGGAFLSMASHGTDQLIVQRLLASGELKKAQKAVIGSGVVVVIQFALFLLLGVLLFAYYGVLNIKSDEIFPKFIIEVLPAGISGLIIAGLFAAAMSTLAGSMSSLSSSTMLDLYSPLSSKSLDDKKKLMLSRIFTIMWAGLLIISALFFMESSKAVIEIALSIASFTYGGLLGTFLLGVMNSSVKQREALVGFSSGILIMLVVIYFNLVAWTWFTLIGVAVTILVASIIFWMGKNK
jgi:SSS family transporter